MGKHKKDQTFYTKNEQLMFVYTHALQSAFTSHDWVYFRHRDKRSKASKFCKCALRLLSVVKTAAHSNMQDRSQF